MYGKNALSTYKSVQVTTTDRGRLLVMLYEGAINFFKQAIQGLENKDMGKFCRYLSKGQAIIAELMNTLDAEKGGAIAGDLERLYEFILFYSTEANLHRDVARLQKCIDLITPVYVAFKEVVDSGLDPRSSTPSAPQKMAPARPTDSGTAVPQPGGTLRMKT